MRFKDLFEAPRNNPADLAKKVGSVNDAERDRKETIRKRNSSNGKLGAQTRAMNKDFKALNKELKNDAKAKAADQQAAVEPEPNKPNTDMSSAEKDLIAPFIKSQIRDRKRKRGVEGDQGVEERDVLDYAQEKYPNVDAQELEGLWKQVSGGDSSPKATDVETPYGSGKDEDPQPNQDEPKTQKKPRRKPSGGSGGGSSPEGSVSSKDMGRILDRIKSMSMKELKWFKKAIRND